MKKFVKGECVGYNPEVRRRSYLKNKAKYIEYSTHYNRLRRIGITKEHYEQMHKSQKGVCAICHQTCSKALAVDHDHETGIIRELLCNSCNRGLGYFKDDKLRLFAAYQYLDKWKL
mgnify:CR=1 FL=1